MGNALRQGAATQAEKGDFPHSEHLPAKTMSYSLQKKREKRKKLFRRKNLVAAPALYAVYLQRSCGSDAKRKKSPATDSSAMKIRYPEILKRLNGVYVALALFGLLHLIDNTFFFQRENAAYARPGLAGLLFNIWGAARNTVAYTMLAASPAWFLGKRSRLPLTVLFCLAVTVEAASGYATTVFHEDLGAVWLQLLKDSSRDDFARFIAMSATPAAIAGVAAVAFALAAGAMLLWRARYPEISKRSAVAGCLFCLPFIFGNCLLLKYQYLPLKVNWKYGLVRTRYCQFVYDTIKSVTAWAGVENAVRNLNLPETLRTECAPDDRPDGVFVLGESSTRNNWHLYGYPRQTTPRLGCLWESGELVKFADVTGTHMMTSSALALLLTDVVCDDMAHGNWTLAEAYRRAGYRCILISNQNSAYDKLSALYRIFNGCEKRLSPQTVFGAKGYDEKLVEILEKELASGDGRPTIAFVHFSGMHFPVVPHDIHPPEDAYFTDAVDAESMRGFSPETRDRLNRYDNGIRHEDKVLAMIVDAMRKSKRPSFMFYMSDHGETPRSAVWRDHTDIDCYELPAVAWLSRSYRAKFPDFAAALEKAAARPMQPDEMTWGLLDFGFVRGLPQSRASFLSDGFKGRNPRLIDNGRVRR